MPPPPPDDTEVSLPQFSVVDRGDRLSDQVVAQIREMILASELLPGDRLPSERELSEQFGVSRTVVREAMRSLHAKGLVESIGNGNRVVAVNQETVRESMGLFLRGNPISYQKVHEIRVSVEVEGAGLAAERWTENEMDRLLDLQRTHAQATDDPDRAAELDVAFHRVVADATQNELYGLVLDMMGDTLLSARRATSHIEGRIAKGVSAHQEVLERILARDVEGARTAMRLHLQDSLVAWSHLRPSELT